ncbi:IclR family transcriptional regulator C-terminal domain-containing protein, partial [Devosia nitrariae]|uniref:IclR family transcriptional regulator domain-containing protein n=1 Tax=Devosia nitrariae TaxID=2071872 RepID=UPI0035EAA2FA
MVNSGMGKALLATYSPADVSAIISKYGMHKLTANSLTRAGDLRDDLAQVLSACAPSPPGAGDAERVRYSH